MEKSKLQKNKCWEWSGSLTNKGYGVMRIKGVSFSAHRLSWLLFHGGGLVKLNVLHKCDNRKCFNPEHLFLGTNQDNNKDRDTKGRQARGINNHTAKLSEKDVFRIRKLIASGTSQSELAREYKVNFSTIHYIVIGKTWKHI